MNHLACCLGIVIGIVSQAGWASEPDPSATPQAGENKPGVLALERKPGDLTGSDDSARNTDDKTATTPSSLDYEKGVSFGGGNYFQGGFQFRSSFGDASDLEPDGSATDSGALAIATLILPEVNTDPNRIRSLHEDLIIMSEILQEGIRPFLVRPDEPGNLDSSSPSASWKQGNRCTYIEGYGALFLLYADFPLAARGGATSLSRPERRDLVWETAKERVWNTRQSRNSAQTEFDPQRIERLKDNLIQALRHGSNIRGLPEKEWIIVAVQSLPPKTASSGFDYFYRRTSLAPVSEGKDPGRHDSSVLILRISKGDVNAFAEDRLTIEAFQKKVHAIAY